MDQGNSDIDSTSQRQWERNDDTPSHSTISGCRWPTMSSHGDTLAKKTARPMNLSQAPHVDSFALRRRVPCLGKRSMERLWIDCNMKFQACNQESGKMRWVVETKALRCTARAMLSMLRETTESGRSPLHRLLMNLTILAVREMSFKIEKGYPPIGGTGLKKTRTASKRCSFFPPIYQQHPHVVIEHIVWDVLVNCSFSSMFLVRIVASWLAMKKTLSGLSSHPNLFTYSAICLSEIQFCMQIHIRKWCYGKNTTRTNRLRHPTIDLEPISRCFGKSR